MSVAESHCQHLGLGADLNAQRQLGSAADPVQVDQVTEGQDAVVTRLAQGNRAVGQDERKQLECFAVGEVNDSGAAAGRSRGVPTWAQGIISGCRAGSRGDRGSGSQWGARRHLSQVREAAAIGVVGQGCVRGGGVVGVQAADFLGLRSKSSSCGFAGVMMIQQVLGNDRDASPFTWPRFQLRVFV